MTSLTRADADTAVERLRVYSQPQRLMILASLLGGERTVGGIEAATGVGQPTLSQQLAELRRADMVLTRRVAKQVFYRLADDKTLSCVRAIVTMFAWGDYQPGVPPPRPAGEPKVGAAGAALFARLRP